MEPMLALLIDCCRARLSADDMATLAPRLARADGAQLARLARRHRVEGLVWRALSRVEVVPLGAQPIREEARRAAAEGLRMALESGRIHRAFARASLPHLFLKGQTLGVLAWGDPLLKRQIDIDLLVPQTAVGKAARLLDEHGYIQQLPDASVDPSDWHRSRKESVWRGDDGFLIDLHTRVADNRSMLPTVTAKLAPRMVELPGGLSMPTLPEGLLLPYLAVHGASSAWFRLKWLADFAALAETIPTARLGELAEQAPRLGAGRTMVVALVLANRLFATKLPTELEYDGASRRMVALALKALSDAREPTERRLGTLAIHHSQMLMVPGSHYFLGELARKLGHLFIR
jgi:hypothetical protein